MKGKSFSRIWLLGALLVSLLSGCDVIEEDVLPVSSLAGTWFGAYQYNDSVTGVTDATLAIVVNSSGVITEMRRDGASLGLTGTITNVGGSRFTFVLSDGSEGGFLADASGTHAGFVDNVGAFGALQKGASALGGFTMLDIVGYWSGYSLEFNNNSDFNIAVHGSSFASVNSGFSLSVTDYGLYAYTGLFTSVEAVYGWFLGTWSGSFPSGSGNMRAYLSADKQFAASWACPGSVTSPSSVPGCTFRIWRR